MQNTKEQYNKKLIGKLVSVKTKDYEWKGVVKAVVDSETFGVQNVKTLEVLNVDIFDIEQI